MYEIYARNVNDAWEDAVVLLHAKGVRRDSRFGPVLEYPDPVVTRYSHPWQRVLFDPTRDANPFFHLFESLWMLAGRNDVAYVKQFSSRIDQFSDNGAEFHGAYGKRWRSWFHGWSQSESCTAFAVSEPDKPIDQLKDIITMLRANPDDRRAVLQMWDPAADFNKSGKDFPCNTNIYFKIRQGFLYTTVCCRSNDIVWGCYGANAVHMSTLHEYMAAMIDVQMGPLHQISDSWHGYIETFEKSAPVARPMCQDPYYTGEVRAFPLVSCPELFDYEVNCFVDEEFPRKSGLGLEFRNRFLSGVAVPLLGSWRAYKMKEHSLALAAVNECVAEDWKLAASQWLLRRKW